MKFAFSVLLSVCLLFAGCDSQHQVSFHGQITEITPTTRGYRAIMMLDHGYDGTYLTVEQASRFKVGDIVDWTASYDVWGEWKHLDSISKVK